MGWKERDDVDRSTDVGRVERVHLDPLQLDTSLEERRTDLSMGVLSTYHYRSSSSVTRSDSHGMRSRNRWQRRGRFHRETEPGPAMTSLRVSAVRDHFHSLLLERPRAWRTECPIHQRCREPSRRVCARSPTYSQRDFFDEPRRASPPTNQPLVTID